MRKKITSLLCVMTLLIGMLLLSAGNVQAAEDVPMLDGSYLTHDTESIGYSSGRQTPEAANGEDLLTGYSKIVVLGAGRIYAGGTTVAAHEVESIQIVVMVERAKEGATSWDPYESWDASNHDVYQLSSNRSLDVEGDYYYRVRCIHAANDDGSSSFTDGVYVPVP